ncbi:hypothetical protein LTR10_018866 [Elasticomyces elasticus]|uniref:Peptidase C45 hydrolase domain-containing protein n=1 Tax=Exophiala sideris TaxID=1016849 RepID=A0ABR0IW26_9EURO|nr:hypothetical protein LTR10_018866 [Elasticomyces elasticus]KAK5021665.1 hypothetical protein LTS07_010836 [Exophiala sideris]KAK5024830.1 hypothetical protein LTR13_010673 [Exophiala sideris]KAK5049803.1 hypothetical protein LTR69_010860 [Exophiala sideris]KAK5176784.1 hypothetical protein LTR44_010727 [Eurotiomycetes sp. CCFEE 6388]
MVWQGVPEIVCHGTPTEIGLCHGTVARDRIQLSIKNYTLLYEETANMSWSLARSRAEAYLPTLDQLVPEIVEEMKAIAQGAEVDLLDIVALNIRSEISLTSFPDEAPDGCTSLGQATDAGKDAVFIAQNWDWTAEAADAIVLFDIQRTTDGTPRIQMLGEAGLVAKFGFNDKGLALCMNAIKSPTVDHKKLPVHIAERKALEAGSFHEAKAVLDRFGLASCVNFMIADKSGNLATIGCTPLGNFVISPDSAGSVCHSNHLISQDKPEELKDYPAENSFNRLERMKEISAGVKPSFETIRKRLSDETHYPKAICRYAEPGTHGMESICTLCTIIMDVRNMKAEVSLGRPSLNPPVRLLVM